MAPFSYSLAEGSKRKEGQFFWGHILSSKETNMTVGVMFDTQVLGLEFLCGLCGRVGVTQLLWICFFICPMGIVAPNLPKE